MHNFPIELLVAIIGILGIVLSAVLGGIGWLIKRAVDGNKEHNELQAEAAASNAKATDENAKAILMHVGELTNVVNEMSKDNAVVANTLEFQNEKLIEHSTALALMLRKVDKVESKVDTLKGKCEARHEKS